MPKCRELHFEYYSNSHRLILMYGDCMKQNLDVGLGVDDQSEDLAIALNISICD